MREYEVTITETLEMTVAVEAESREEAQQIASDNWKNGDYISGVVPQDAPPPDYFDFMRELHGVGNNLNQIAQKAHVLGVIDERRYDEEMRKFDQLVRDITKAVILPRPME